MDRKIGVIGCGYWGKNLIRTFYDLNKLVAICDTDKDKLNVFKKKYPDLKQYDNVDSLLKNQQVKAVVIAAQASYHYDLSRRALLANKDVMVEKPMALHLEEAEQLVLLSKKKNRILMVGHILLYHPAISKLKEMILRGELGKIQYIYSNRLNLGKFRKEENILWSFAPHDISVILHFLEEMPHSVSTTGGNYLNSNVTDVTITSLGFPSGVNSHIFVSWLHPYKDQRLVIVGDKKMAVFNDVDPKNKLQVYNHKIAWIDRTPIAQPEYAMPVEIEDTEPLKLECNHFIDCIEYRKQPLTDGLEGLRVLEILEACQKSLNAGGKIVEPNEKERGFFVHISAHIDEPFKIGKGTKIWHFSHVLKNCKIGKNCVLGQNVSIGPNVRIGNNVKIQNNVSVYEGVTLEDDVFCGPSMVFTNVINPRSHWPRKKEFKQTLVRRGASLGANSTILCGITIGQYAFIGAGSFVNKDVPDFAIAYGAPARIRGWMCYCGAKIGFGKSEKEKTSVCSNCGRKYKKQGLIVSEISGSLKSLEKA